ncbi:MAG: flavin reductase [Candidatus ainarchaeum sp.]|nr:flavin reductase [Candidatus ainarchaeum sp.]
MASKFEDKKEKIMSVPLYAAFNLCAPRPVAVLTTIRKGLGIHDEYFARMPGFSYNPDFDYDAAPMSTLTLQGKRPPKHTGPFESAGPPVHLVSVTGTRKTYAGLLETGEAVANFLWPKQKDVEKMYVLSDGSYNSGNKKIKDSGFTLQDSQKLNVPIIREAMSWIEYKLIRMVEVPESERPIFLLEPVAAYSLEGLVDSKTYTYVTKNVPVGQLGANIFSGKMQNSIVAKRRTQGMKFTLPQHWEYSDKKR